VTPFGKDGPAILLTGSILCHLVFLRIVSISFAKSVASGSLEE